MRDAYSYFTGYGEKATHNATLEILQNVRAELKDKCDKSQLHLNETLECYIPTITDMIKNNDETEIPHYMIERGNSVTTLVTANNEALKIIDSVICKMKTAIDEHYSKDIFKL
ncbi:hypothetical protein CJD92_22345 [Salmonella enterica subsp. enterica serovar Newport]|nr:hypothetical protein [Salmonella enterica subsp. enterica serovar Newport]